MVFETALMMTTHTSHTSSGVNSFLLFDAVSLLSSHMLISFFLSILMRQHEYTFPFSSVYKEVYMPFCSQPNSKQKVWNNKQ